MEQMVIKDLNRIAQTIYDKKGFNILVLDVRKFSTMTDYYIIAEGNVDRHVKAISQAIADELHQNNTDPLFVEGKQEGDWVVLDYGAYVIHLLISELREKYALEDLWRKAEIVDVVIDTNSSNLKPKM